MTREDVGPVVEAVGELFDLLRRRSLLGSEDPRHTALTRHDVVRVEGERDPHVTVA